MHLVQEMYKLIPVGANEELKRLLEHYSDELRSLGFLGQDTKTELIR